MADQDIRMQAARARVEARREARRAGEIIQKKPRYGHRRLKDGLERSQKLAVKRGGICISKEYKNSTTEMQWKCVNGHEFFMQYGKVRAGQWCPRCRIWRREEMCRLILEGLYDLPFPLSWPEWLIGRNGKRISLDGYSVSLGIAFEHHGQQHYNHIDWFHRGNNSLDARRELDARRVWQCKRNNVLLLEIPYWVKQEDLPGWIVEKLVELGAPSPKNKPCVCYPMDVFGSKRLQELRDMVSARGGVLLESEYKGSYEKHKLRCARGHEWSSLPQNIKRGVWCRECWKIDLSQAHTDGYKRAKSFVESRGGEFFIASYEGQRTPCLVRCARGHEWNTKIGDLIRGKWCKKCASVARRMTMERIQEIARQKGGVCLSREYTGRDDKAKWRCANGHEWETFFRNVMSGTWCPKCSKSSVYNRNNRSRVLTIQDMQQAAKVNNGECLSEVYINNITKLRWRCFVGHEWNAVPSSIRQGSWCPECAKISLGKARLYTIEDVCSFAKEKNGACLSSVYVNSREKLRWRCEKGHEWEACFGNIKTGHWCPVCARARVWIIRKSRIALSEVKNG